MSVGSTSKSPERAIMLLERLNTDARYYNLILSVFGLVMAEMKKALLFMRA